MKTLSTTFILFLAIALNSFAQELQNPLRGNDLVWSDTYFPITDTLVFELPNEGSLILYYNNKEHSDESLTSIFSPLLERATDFPEFKTLAYRLNENYAGTSLKNVTYDIEANYVPYLDSIELRFPVGLDFTGGDFTPTIGLRTHLNLRKFSIGGAISNTIFFPERIDGNVKVNSNWFVDAEFAWEFGNVQKDRRNTFGVGYLLNEGNSELFSGTTMRAFYNRKLNKNISLQVGVIATENFKTFYPTIGVRFW